MKVMAKLSDPLPIKANSRFGGGVCLCICLFVSERARPHWPTRRHVTLTT